MASYRDLSVENGFKKGTEVGASVTIGATVDLKVSIQVHAKTVSDVHSQLEKVKSSFSSHTWEKIQAASVGGELGFFTALFDFMAGGSYEYYNRTRDVHIQQAKEAQVIAKAFHESNTSDVVIEGAISATGKSYIPTTAYVWVNQTVVKIDHESFTAVTNNPIANAADINGDDSKTSGHGKLHILPSTVKVDKQRLHFLRAS